MTRLAEATKICADKPKGMSAKQYRLFNPAGAAKLAGFLAEHHAEIVAELTDRVMQDGTEYQQRLRRNEGPKAPKPTTEL